MIAPWRVRARHPVTKRMGSQNTPRPAPMQQASQPTSAKLRTLSPSLLELYFSTTCHIISTRTPFLLRCRRLSCRRLTSLQDLTSYTLRLCCPSWSSTYTDQSEFRPSELLAGPAQPPSPRVVAPLHARQPAWDRFLVACRFCADCRR